MIPFYNCERWLAECLNSVLIQTFPAWNAIVIDDASTDHSPDIIKMMVGSDPRFTVVRNTERRTALANIMDACRAGTGDYVAILDGDDAFLDTDTLDMIFAVYNDAPDVVATSGQYVRWPDGGIGHCSASQPPGVSWFEGWQYGHTLTARRDICVEMMDAYPTAYLDIDTGKPYLTCYDLAWYFPTVAWAEWNNKRIAHLPTPNYLYRRWEGNDDSSAKGLAEQTLAARKISLYWMNEMFKHDFAEGNKVIET